MPKILSIILATLLSTAVYADTLYETLSFYFPPDNMTLLKKPKLPLDKIETLLRDKKTGMRDAVVDKVLATLNCAYQKNIDHKPILAVIDFSSASNQKRFWVFDLKRNRLLYHSYVSHGIKSGEMISSFFSNRHNSKASSIGVYKTLFSYYGRHGYALRLDGLENNFNSNAQGRAIVMHGAWYVSDDFINKYGRPGRSWGCPAVPLEKTKGIINTIKNDALLVAYYPSDTWMVQSEYINCDGHSERVRAEEVVLPSDIELSEKRSPILYIEKNDNGKREENEPIIIVSAEEYQQIFQKKAPLKRMIRRQINNKEYIALNHDEFKKIIDEKPNYLYPQEDNYKQAVLFVIPEVKRIKGYYATEMKEVPIGNITEIKEDLTIQDEGIGKPLYAIQIENKPSLEIHSTGQFIRWLGL